MENDGLNPEEAKAGIWESDAEHGLDDEAWDLAGQLVGKDGQHPDS